MQNYRYTAIDRFLRYVKIDTQSDPQSTTNPSTEKQKDLSRVLVQELLDMGIADAELDQWGYVYATIPANTNKASVPTICFCSHVDTSPDVTGEGVKPTEIGVALCAQGRFLDCFFKTRPRQLKQFLRLRLFAFGQLD